MLQNSRGLLRLEEILPAQSASRPVYRTMTPARDAGRTHSRQGAGEDLQAWTPRQRQALISGGAVVGFATGLTAAQFPAWYAGLVGLLLLVKATRDYLLGFSRGWSRND